MGRFNPTRLVLLLMLFRLPLSSQDTPALRIGVALPTSSADLASDTRMRDRLVKLLNQHRNEKKLKAPLEAIALSSPPGGRAVAEATKKICQYVLYTRVKPIEISSLYQPSYSDQTIGTRPVVKARVEYLLRRLSDGFSYASGTASSDEVVSDTDALIEAVDRIASAVVSNLKKGDSVARRQQKGNMLEAIAPVAKPDALPGRAFCEWLPSDIAHADALRGVCEYAMTLPEKMPNFVCREETRRFEGRNSVPQDLITASVRYEDGDESYSDLKLNGKPVAEGAAGGAGLWSSGQFEGGLRAVFHSGNHPEFDYFGEDEANAGKAWVFTFEIDQQNEPLWQLRGKDEVVAPAYGGEIWVDEKTGEVVRFRSTAKDLPPTFPIQSAEVQTDYGLVTFGDGTGFVLPVDSSVATRYEGMQPTKNVMRFSSCRKFGAKSRILTGTPSKSTGSGAIAQVDDDSLIRELDENETIYAIAQQDAIRDDDTRLQADHNLDLTVATVGTLWKLAALEKQRESVIAKEAAKQRESAAAQNLPTYKVKVNLVSVSVVARDKQGQAVGTLAKEDFRLFDERKPQIITRFSVEKDVGAQSSEKTTNLAKVDTSSQPPSAQGTTLQTRNIAYIFDDLHTSFEDLENAVKAAEHNFAEMRTQDRAAVFTTSGDVELSFTADREKLQSVLRKAKAHPLGGWNCPPMTYYEADLIVNHADSNASDQAVADATDCAHPGTPVLAKRLAMSRALEVATEGRVASDQSFKLLDAVIAGMAPMPGSKSIVLVSPGFLALTPDAQDRAMALIDRALQVGVVVNTLDVSGLTTNMSATLDRPGTLLDEQEAGARNATMADLAYGTGGTFFHNNNNLNDGFRRTTEVPEYIYVLGFAPQKLDGKFHKLKVTLKSPEKLSVQARPGYYAVKPAE